MPVIVLILLMLLLPAGILVTGCMDGSDDLVIVSDEDWRVSQIREECLNFTAETGITCRVIANANLTDAREADVLVTDVSRFSPLAAEKRLVPLKQVFADTDGFDLKTIEWPVLTLFGEYPDGSGEIYALPYAPDPLGLVTRGDLFSDTDKAAFRTKYGYELTAPASWDELRDMATFWNDPEGGRYGIALPGCGHPDHAAFMSSLLVSHGWDRDTDNIPAAVKNLTGAYISLASPTAPDWSADDAMVSVAGGESALAITWFSSFSTAEGILKEKNTTGVFWPLPGASLRGIAIRGAVMGISSTANHREKAGEYLSWLFSEKTQYQAERYGRFPVIAEVIDSPGWRGSSPFHPILPESLRMGTRIITGSGGVNPCNST